MTLDELKELMETGEEFEMEGFSGIFRFNKSIGEFENNSCGCCGWHEVYITTHHLFSSKLIRKPWKPKVGETYWHWIDDGDFEYFHASKSDFDYCSYDLVHIAFGNCFRTREECEAHTEVRDKLIAMRKEYE